MIPPSSKLPGLALTGSLLLLIPCHALVDLDGDGMSDVWENAYGLSTTAGVPAPPDQAPGADPDGDGYSNLRESQMGTDPHSTARGIGVVRPSITKEAGYLNLYTITWPARADQYYSLEASTDLTPDSWFYVYWADSWDGSDISLGIEAQDMEDGNGVKITDVDEDEDDDPCPAAKAGLKEDDIITQVNGKAIKSVDDLRESLKDVKKGDTVKITYKRNNQTQTVDVKFPKELKTIDL